MRVITTTGIRQISVILRDYALTNNYSTFVRNESTGSVVRIDTTQTIAEIQSDTDFFTFIIEDEYEEGDELDFYIVETDSDLILHRNKIYVTDQFNEPPFFLLLETGFNVLLESDDKIELEAI